VSLDIDPISRGAVRLSGSGFEPGEELEVLLSRENRYRGYMDWRFIGFLAVAANGHFSGALHIPGPVVTDTWEFTVIHGDSAICRTVTMSSYEGD
jgi:hypothetical protein